MPINYSKWLKESELKDLRGVELVNYHDVINSSGMPLSVDGNKMLIDTSLTSNLIIGATGSGKTQSTVLPMLNLIARANESAIVTDSNGELYKCTAEIFKKRGYKVHVINFQDPNLGECWNPLLYPYHLYKNNKKDEAIDLLQNLAHAILSEKSTADPFWEHAASTYFTALALGLFQDGDEEEINLNSIGMMLSQGEEKIGLSIYAKEYFKRFEENDPAYINALLTVAAPNETKGSILSVLRQKLNIYLSRENLCNMISGYSINLNDIRNKTIIYLIMPINTSYVYPLVTSFIEQTHYILMNTDSKIRFNYILDDFDMLSPIKNLDMLITTSRAKNVNFTLLIRNYQNLNVNYGVEQAKKIINACANIYYLLTDDINTAREISNLCGVKSVGDKLITEEELLRLGQWEVVALKMRCYPIKLKLTPNYKIDWEEEISESQLQSREHKDIKVFNLKSFVNSNIETFDDLIKKIDEKIEELDKEDRDKDEELKKIVIEKTVSKVEIEKNKITVYYK